MIEAAEFTVKTLGPCRVDSPLALLLAARRRSVNNVDETDRVLFDDIASDAIAREVAVTGLPGFEPAGPRKKLYLDPATTRAGIVTCGGLCPGFNDVIRALVMELTFRYGVKRVIGFCNGYLRMVARFGRAVMDLTPDVVAGINETLSSLTGAPCITRRGSARTG